MRNVVIVGASGHGGMILDCLKKEEQYNVVGFVDTFKRKGSEHYGLKVLGNEYDLPRLTESLNLSGLIFAIGNNWTRKTVADKISEIVPRLEVISAIHPSAVIADGVKIGKGSVVMAGAIINAKAQMGDYCILNTKASLGHDGVMQDFSSIASGVCTGGNLDLGRFSAISLGANVIEHIKIGKHSVVGAGSLVVKNVGSFCVVYGSPAKMVRKRDIEDNYLSGDALVEEKKKVVHIKKLGS